MNDAFAEAAVEAIMRGIRTVETSRLGDGKITVTPREDCTRIRTGETGPSAIGP